MSEYKPFPYISPPDPEQRAFRAEVRHAVAKALCLQWRWAMDGERIHQVDDCNDSIARFNRRVREVGVERERVERGVRYWQGAPS